MRKKNHQKRNANGGKATRKQEVSKVEKSIKKEELSIILQIQNLINDDIIKNNSSNANCANLHETKNMPNLICGSDQSDIDDSANNSIIDFGLSKFVSFSSDSEDDTDSDAIEFESDCLNSESQNGQPINDDDLEIDNDENKKLDEISNSLKFQQDKTNFIPIDSIKNDSKENVANMMKKPLLSLCNNAKVTKPKAQNPSVSNKTYPIQKYTFECLLCPSKFRKIMHFERHMKKKHPDHQSTTINGINNVVPKKTDNSKNLIEKNMPSSANINSSIKKAMSNIIKGRIMKLLKVENGLLGKKSKSQLSQNEPDSFNLLAEKLVEKIVHVSDSRFYKEFSKTELKSKENDDDFLSEFEL